MFTPYATMRPMDAGVAVVVGGLITGTFAVLVPTTASVLERRRRLREEEAKRLGDFLAATWAAVMAISEVACAPMAEKRQLRLTLDSPTVDRVNSALTQLELHAEPADLVAFRSLDDALVRLSELAEAKEYAPDEWRVVRSSTISVELESAKAAARERVRPGSSSGVTRP